MVKAASGSNVFADIASETSASYTVKSVDGGVILRATATYTVTATYTALLSARQTASADTAEVEAVNDPPVFADVDHSGAADPVWFAVAENTTAGNVGSAVTAADPDSDALTYSVAAGTGADAAGHLVAFNEDFTLDASTGQVTVKADAVIDYESRTSYVVSYRVSDLKDAAGGVDTVIDDTLVLTVNVTNVNEAGTVSISGDPEAGVLLTASLTDPDGAVASLAWQWSKAASGSNVFADIASATSASYTVDSGDVGEILRATVTYTDTTHIFTYTDPYTGITYTEANQTASADTAAVPNVNDPPVFAAAAVTLIGRRTRRQAMWVRRSPPPILTPAMR